MWNIAADSVVNAFLKQDGLPLIEGAIDLPEAINFDVEELYQKLLNEKQKHYREGNDVIKNESNQEQNQSNDKLWKYLHEAEQHDIHSIWDEVVKIKNQVEPQYSNEYQNRQRENKRIEEFRKIAELGEKEVFKQNRIQKRKQLEELRKSLVCQSHGHGTDSISEERNVTDVGTSEPLIDWKRLLIEMVKYDVDWSYQNAVIEDGVITACLEEIPKAEVEILLDTSGSINEALFKNFLRECKNIMQTFKVKVGCFDTKFYGFVELKNVSDIDNFSFPGRGGTDFEVAVNAFTKNADNRIIFTDGEAGMPSTPMDAIWIVFGGIEINPIGGKVIYINDEQLEKLYNHHMNDLMKNKSR